MNFLQRSWMLSWNVVYIKSFWVAVSCSLKCCMQQHTRQRILFMCLQNFVIQPWSLKALDKLFMPAFSQEHIIFWFVHFMNDRRLNYLFIFHFFHGIYFLFQTLWWSKNHFRNDMKKVVTLHFKQHITLHSYALYCMMHFHIYMKK